MTLEHFGHVQDLIRESARSGLAISTAGLFGYSGDALVGFLQRLARYQERRDRGCYLEIGVFQGLTLISVAKSLAGRAFGIDNFAQFDRSGKNRAIVAQRAEANSVDNIVLINEDYEDALHDLPRHLGDLKVATYFVDGPHDYRSQLVSLLLARPHLSEGAVIVVDDCNYRHVRLANRDFLLSHREFKLLFETYSRCHPGNLPTEEERLSRSGWWNGVNVLVHDPADVLAPMLPPTLRDRQLHENEHVVHGLKHAVLAPEAVRFLSALSEARPIEAAKALASGLRRLRRTRQEMIGGHLSMNTYSEDLSPTAFNPSLEVAPHQ